MADSSERPLRVRVLEEGAKLTAGDREKVYGSPVGNMQDSADMWTAYLKTKYGFDAELRGDDVAHMMELFKMARTFRRNTFHEDNYIDGATYNAIAGECRAHDIRELARRAGALDQEG